MDDSSQAADHATAIHVGAGGRVGDITVQGDVAGRDIIKITEELAYDVSDLSTNPYLGLASYTYAARSFYGGREPQIRSAVQRLTAPGEELVLLFVTGASGSGKSSFAQAGMLPALEEAYTTQGRRVRWSVTRPGRHPIAALGRALEDLGFSEPPDADWTTLLRTPEDLNLLLATQTPQKQINVLIFDQFEELFTQSELAERDTACALLSALGAFARLHTHVIATLRADYLPALFDVPSLFECSKQNGIELRAMAPDELARAMRRPIQEQARLESKDKRLDPALVERLVDDVGGDPALLPLLQVTLRALWDEPPHRMVIERYRSLTHTLEQQANQLVDHDHQGRERPAAEQEQLMGIFLDLVEVSLDDDPRRDVRHTLPKQELLEGHPERAKLIEDLVSARLVTTSVEHGRDTAVEVVDIIHETLLSSWPRLSEEIVAQREALQQRERFRLALREWLQNGRSADYLLQGVRLAEARSLVDRNDVALRDADGRAFLQASSDAEAEAHRQELRQAHRRQRVLGVAAGVAALFAVAAISAAGFAFSQRQEALHAQNDAEVAKGNADEQAARAVAASVYADDQRSRAEDAQQRAEQQALVATSRELAASAVSQLPTDPELSLLLAVEAVHKASTDEGTAALRQALTSSHVRITLRGHSGPVRTAAFSPDGQRIVTASDDGTARVWNAGSGGELYQLQHPSKATGAAFSPDGQRVVTTDSDGTARLWDVPTTVNEQPSPSSNTPRFVLSAAGVRSTSFSPDGALVVTGSPDGARVFDASSGRLVAQRLIELGAPKPQTLSVVWKDIVRPAFSPDSRLVVSAGGFGNPQDSESAAGIWEARTGRELATLRHPEGVIAAAFSSDGQRVFTTSFDMTPRVWDATTGQELITLTKHAGQVIDPVFSLDGSRLLTAGEPTDTTLQLWDVATATEPALLLGHTDRVTHAAFSSDSKLVVAAAQDGTVRVWKPVSGPEFETLSGHSSAVNNVAFDAAGGRVLTASADGTARVWAVDTWRQLGASAGPKKRTDAAVFSPDGERLLTIDSDGTDRVWAATTGEQVASWQVLGETLRPGVFSPDGGRVFTVRSRDGTAQVWDAATGAQLESWQLPLQQGNPAAATAFSPDGERILTVGFDGTGRVWAAATGQQLTLWRPPTKVSGLWQAAFTQDGTHVLATVRQVGAASGTMWVWDAATGADVDTIEKANVAASEPTGDGRLAIARTPYGARVLQAGTDTSVFELNSPAGMSHGDVWSGATVFNPTVEPALSPDGHWIVMGDPSGGVWLHRCDVCASVEDMLKLAQVRVTRELSAAERQRYLHGATGI